MIVEGASDRIALETLASRLGRDLATEGVSIVALGGASGLGEYLQRLLDRGDFGGNLGGLCDEGEVGDFARGLERAGIGTGLDREAMEALGFFVCVTDLEDELIRALGTAVVEAVIESQGELRGFRTMQRQLAWRGRALEDQLHRFLGIRSGRKARYARLLTEALDLGRVPYPLRGVLEAV